MKQDHPTTTATFFLVAICLICQPGANAQNPEWMNFCDDNWVEAMAEEGDLLWIASRVGLVKLNKKTGEKELYNSASRTPGNMIRAIAIDQAGNKWIAGDGVAKFDGTHWTYFHTENSPLPNDYVTALLVDHRNNVWIGTSSGLVRSDGHSWTIYPNLVQNWIPHLAEDKSGNIWMLVSSYEGLRLLRWHEDQWASYPIPYAEFGYEFIQAYNLAIANDGTIWIATAVRGVARNHDLGGVWHFDGTHWTIYRSSNTGLPVGYFWSVALDKLGHVWVARGNGVAEFDGNTWLKYGKGNSALSGFRVQSIFVDQDNTKWIGDVMQGLVRFDGQTWTVYPLRTAPTGVHTNKKIVIDKSGAAWLGDWGQLIQYDGTTWRTFDYSNSPLPQVFSYYYDMKKDENDHLWIAPRDQLFRFDGSRWYEYPDHFTEPVSAILNDQNHLVWLGTGGGLIAYDVAASQIINQFTPENSSLPKGMVTALVRDNQNLWVGTDDGLAKYDGRRWTLYDTTNSDLSDNHITSLALDRNGRLWIGQFWGLASFDGTNWTRYPELNAAWGSPFVSSLVVDMDQNIWIASSSNGIVKFDGERWQFFNTINSGLSENQVQTLAMDESGNLWIGLTNSGIDIYKAGGISGSFKPYAEEIYSQRQTHIPGQQAFFHIFPNPFNQFTTIRIDLNKPTFVRAKVFDLLGREVATLIEGQKSAGSHYTAFDGRELANGVYFLRIEAGGKSFVQKLVLLK